MQPHQIGMTWQYTIDWIPGGIGSGGGTFSKNVVVVSSKPRSRSESDLILVDAWTSELDGENDSSDAVSAFVRVTRGGMPVLGARVRMEVGRVDEGTTILVADMLDDGYGGKLFSLIMYHKP